jgi:RHS repeat-associated protein
VLELNDDEDNYTKFYYDSINERIMKKNISNVSEMKKLYIHGLSSFPLATFSDSEFASFFIYGPKGIVAKIQNDNCHFVIKDHLGSSRLILNEENEVLSSYSYDAFGNLMTSTVSEDVAYQYTGQEYDSELDLHNFRARFYDSDLMRFYAVDPLEEFSSSYLFCGNNPITFIDPTGKGMDQASQNQAQDTAEAERREKEIKEQTEAEKKKSKGEEFKNKKSSTSVEPIAKDANPVNNNSVSEPTKQNDSGTAVSKENKDSTLKTTLEMTAEGGIDVASTVAEHKGFLNIGSILGAIGTWLSTKGTLDYGDKVVRVQGMASIEINGPMSIEKGKVDSVSIYIGRGEFEKAKKFQTKVGK